jgi:TPR repeat protein
MEKILKDLNTRFEKEFLQELRVKNQEVNALTSKIRKDMEILNQKAPLDSKGQLARQSKDFIEYSGKAAQIVKQYKNEIDAQLKANESLKEVSMLKSKLKEKIEPLLSSLSNNPTSPVKIGIFDTKPELHKSLSAGSIPAIDLDEVESILWTVMTKKHLRDSVNLYLKIEKSMPAFTAYNKKQSQSSRLNCIEGYAKSITKGLKASMPSFLKAYQERNMHAAYCLGFNYGLLGDWEGATKYFIESAETDNIFATCYLGRAYVEGCGIEKNEAKGLLLLERAVKLELSAAQNILGYYYFSRNNATQADFEKAVDLIKKSAQQGFCVALQNLGKFYSKGLAGLPVDLPEAIKWLELATRQNDPYAWNILREIYEQQKNLVMKDYAIERMELYRIDGQLQQSLDLNKKVQVQNFPQ